MDIKTISGPIIGAVIGYFTNYLAVKMLFRPLKPIMIGKLKVPFTPGIIPKGQKRLAKAFGNVVGNTLVTEDDIIKTLLSDDIKESIENEVVLLLSNEDLLTLNNLFSTLNIEQKKIENIYSYLSIVITEKVMEGITKINIGNVIADEGTKAIKEKVSGSFLAMMVNDQLLDSFAEPISDRINQYILENGEDLIRPYVGTEVRNLGDKSMLELLNDLNISKDEIIHITNEIYSRFINDKVSAFVKKLNLSSIVENKINEMDVLEIEDLLLSVMRNELDAIVKLGAPIGFIIGLINLII